MVIDDNHHRRYRKMNVSDAIELALKDLCEAPETLSSPRDPCKMHAVDLLVTVTSLRPDLISNDIVDTCRRMFSECNATAQIEIIRIMGLLGRREYLDFLISITQDTGRTNCFYMGKDGDGRSIPILVRNNSKPDWVRDAAEEAIKVIKGELDISPSNQWIIRQSP